MHAENVAIDLQTFANHANRSTVTSDDVLLITRRNEALEGIIRDFIDSNKTLPKQGSRINSNNANGKTKNGTANRRVENKTAKSKRIAH